MQNDKFALDFISDPSNYYLADDKRLVYNTTIKFLPQDLTLYHIEEITYEDKAPRKKALENVLSAMKIEGINFVYLISGDKQGVHFYFGVVKDLYEKTDLSLSVRDIGKYILEPSIRGNFRGSKMSEVNPLKKEEICNKIDQMKYYSMLEGVPGISKDNENFQGVDRLVDVMLGDEFGLMIVAKPLNYDDITEIEENLYKLYSSLIPFVKQSIQEGVSKGSGNTKTQTTGNSKSSSYNQSKTYQIGKSKNEGKSITTCNTTQEQKGNNSSISKSGTEGTTSGTATNESNTDTKGESTSTGTNESITVGDSTSDSKSNNLSFDVIDKTAQDWIKYLDEAIIPRMDYGKGKGMFLSTAFLFSENQANLNKLENTIMSLYSGESQNKVPLKPILLINADKRLEVLKRFQVPAGTMKSISQNEIYTRTSLSQYINKECQVCLGNWISTNELSLVAGLPQKEIVGLGLREEVEFGLNYQMDVGREQKIHIGSLVQSGHVFDNIEVFLDKQNLDKHVFVTGVTGSGKTTTCQKLLIDSNIPFLVIEPAKTEYRILTKRYDQLLIFTLGKDAAAPFRLNPFEFFKHESITSRVDMIKASIEAAFDMEAAIPQIIETSIYECYKDYGWNIATNKNEKYENPFADGVYAFPILEDLVQKVEIVIQKQGFDERLKRDYIGSVKARLQGLLVGSKGLMLNTKRSVDFEDLLDRRVILELEEIRSAAEKSLIMGFILTNLIEAIKAKYLKNGKLNHITLVEEAHRLLSRYMPGDSQNKKQGVETFADMLAEIRKYGESLIIADQIPDKLTPEVLKNTNTKIVHRIFAQDDKDAIGNTMALTEEQKEFLSNLEAGRAIVFTQGWAKALQVQIDKTTNTTGEEMVTDAELRTNILQFYQKSYKRGVFQGLEYFKGMPELTEVDTFIEFVREGKLVDFYSEYLQSAKINPTFEEYVKEISAHYGVDFLAKYIVGRFYIEEDKSSLISREKLVNSFLNDIVNGQINSKNISYYFNQLDIRR